MVRISLLAVTKNRVKMIEKALPEWCKLKGKEDELIVVDGDSKDGTYELLKREEGKLIDILIHEQDMSEADAINKGFAKARGVLVKIISDDDIFYPDALELEYKAMIENPDIDILITGGVRAVLDSDGTISKIINYQWLDETSSINNIENLIGICGIGMLIRRSSIKELGLINPDHYLADTSYLIQAHLKGANIRYIRVKGFFHFYHNWSAFSQGDRIKNEYRKIMKDFQLKPKGKLIRAIQNPRKAMIKLLSGIRMHEPVWDGKII